MKLFLLRHGDAVSANQDPERPLSAHGRQQAEAVGERARERGLSAGTVLHSTKLRAKETAELVCARALPSANPRETDGLKPGDSPRAWLDRVNEAEEDLLLVGHNPFMEIFAELLTGELVPFGTATLAAFERGEDGSWSLAWKL